MKHQTINLVYGHRDWKQASRKRQQKHEARNHLYFVGTLLIIAGLIALGSSL